MIAPRGTWELEVRPASERHAWLEALHVTHGPGLRRMLRGMLGDENEVLDVYQDCMCRLARRYGQTPFRNVSAYAYRTAANLATETIRRRSRRAAHWSRVVTDQRTRGRLVDTPPQDASEPDHCGPLRRLPAALRALPRHLRDVIVLRDLAQMPYRQVAGALGIQPTTARVYRRQAIIRLGRALEGPGPADAAKG